MNTSNAITESYLKLSGMKASHKKATGRRNQGYLLEVDLTQEDSDALPFEETRHHARRIRFHKTRKRPPVRAQFQ